VECGADLNKKGTFNGTQSTPLEIAKENQRHAVVAYLRSKIETEEEAPDHEVQTF